MNAETIKKIFGIDRLQDKLHGYLLSESLVKNASVLKTTKAIWPRANESGTYADYLFP